MKLEYRAFGRRISLLRAIGIWPCLPAFVIALGFELVAQFQ